jgi:F420H(2)-dependent quinone reductase
LKAYVGGMQLQPSTIKNLAATRTIDLTTIGKRTGEHRTVEIWWFHVDGRFIITGTPGRRDWVANVRADNSVLIATSFGEYRGNAVEISDPTFRRRVFTDPMTSWYKTQEELDHLVATAPMVEIVNLRLI